MGVSEDIGHGSIGEDSTFAARVGCVHKFRRCYTHLLIHRNYENV